MMLSVHEKHRDGIVVVMAPHQIVWLSSGAAAKQLGITTRTLYRMISEDHVPAYRFGRVIRLKQEDVDAFIEASRISEGELKHLYPAPESPAYKDPADGGSAGDTGGAGDGSDSIDFG